MTRDQIRDIISPVLQQLIETEMELFLNDVAERAIAHRIGCHLDGKFPGWHVDCEYNRDGLERTKAFDALEYFIRARADQIMQLNREELKEFIGNRKPISVSPDVNVHKRGSRGRKNNLLVMEIKKTTNTESREIDEAKLEHFTIYSEDERSYHYQHGLFLEFTAWKEVPLEGIIVANCTWYSEGQRQTDAEKLASFKFKLDY
jgi:hypothetical protein